MTFFVEGLCKFREIEKQLRRIGDYATLEEAVAASKRAIDEFLLREFKAEMTAAQLYAQYQEFGEVPCVFRDDGLTMSIPGFNHWQYANARCLEICGK
jgi:hypothetical protein